MPSKPRAPARPPQKPAKAPPWQRKPPKTGKPRQQLTPAQLEEARARAAAAGRPYPNLVDNLAVLRKR